MNRPFERTRTESVLQEKGLYHNCVILAPDGLPLSRAGRPRTEWYLRRGLATLISSDPLTIQLKFEPAGHGAREDPYEMQTKVNQCVACGRPDLLTKHHVVPLTFRRHFPQPLKEHKSHDVLMLCLDCHMRYEPEAQKLHRDVCDEFGIVPPPPQERDPQFFARGLCYALTQHSDKIPQERKDFLINRIVELLGYLPNIEELGKDKPHKKRQRFAPYGQAVVTSGIDLEQFNKRWRQHFIEHMKPQFLPPFWDPDRGIDEETKKAMEPQICPTCNNATMVDTIVARDEEHEGVVIHKELPADKCVTCGDVYMSDKSARAEIDQICEQLGRLRPKRLMLLRERSRYTIDSLALDTDIHRDDLSAFEHFRRVPTKEQDIIIRNALRGRVKKWKYFEESDLA